IGPAEQGGLARPCRIYAPVGSHDTLLAYLVRRLLENGANSSFVHRVGDTRIPIDSLVADAATLIREETLGTPHPAIPLPGRLYGDARANAPGFDLNDEATLAALHQSLVHHGAQAVHAGPLLALPPGHAARSVANVSPALAAAAPPQEEARPRELVRNPGERRDTVGSIRWTTEAELAAAAELGARHARIWRQTPVATRAALLEAAADKLHAHHAELMNLLVREAGKTLPNAVGELREAIDFLRYYAAQARLDLRDG